MAGEAKIVKDKSGGGEGDLAQLDQWGEGFGISPSKW
jgi:hypothetical protein